jgi:hypothetical protein
MPVDPPNPDPPQGTKLAQSLASPSSAGRMIQVSFLLPCSAFVGWIIGAGLDKLFHQTWISLVGILFGGISGIVYVVRMVIAMGRNQGQGSGGDSGKPAGGA